MNSKEKDQRIRNRYNKICQEKRNIKARWNKEKQKRYHLISINSTIGNHFDWNLGKIESWCGKLGFDGMEIRIQDFVGFEKKNSRAKLSSFKPKCQLTCHLSDWNAWIDMFYEHKKKLKSQFYSQENIKAYFGATNRSELIAKIAKELKIAKKIGASVATWHANQINYDEILFRKSITKNDTVIQAVNSCIKLLRSKCSSKEISILSLENGSALDTGVAGLDDFAKIFNEQKSSSIGITFDTAHATSLGLRTRVPRKEIARWMMELFESNLGMVKKIKAVHLSDSIFSPAKKIKIHASSLERAKKDFWFKRSLVCENNIDDHLPLGFSLENASELLDLIYAIQRKKICVISELKAGDFKTLEQAILLQKYQICS